MADIFNMTDAWNDAGVAFSAIKMNVTDTASAAGSNLLDLQVGGVSKFSVDKTGFGIAENFFSKNVYEGTSLGGIRFSAGPLGVAVRNSNFIGFASTSILGTGSPDVDVTMFRDNPGVLALRDGTNAQTFNIYNTYTDASNYERGFMRWNSNVLEIGTEAAGTGSPRALDLKSGSNGHAEISFPSSAGNVGGTRVYSFANGRLNITNSGNKNGQLMFGLTSSYGGLTSDGQNVHVRLADDSDDAPLTASHIQVATNYTVATLPGTPEVGMMARVTDATSPATGSTVTGGGTDPALVWYNGANWTVIGV